MRKLTYLILIVCLSSTMSLFARNSSPICPKACLANAKTLGTDVEIVSGKNVPFSAMSSWVLGRHGSPFVRPILRASFALVPDPVVKVHIVVSEHMTLGTVCLPVFPPLEIFRDSHWLKVIRPNAVSVEAEVVELASFRNKAPRDLVDKAMSVGAIPFVVKSSIAFWHFVSDPIPASSLDL